MRDEPKSVCIGSYCTFTGWENVCKTTDILFSTKWCRKQEVGRREKEGKRVVVMVVVKGGGQVDKLVGTVLVSLTVICHQNYYLVVVRYIWCFCPFLSPAAFLV